MSNVFSWIGYFGLIYVLVLITSSVVSRFILYPRIVKRLNEKEVTKSMISDINPFFITRYSIEEHYVVINSRANWYNIFLIKENHMRFYGD